MAGPHFMTGERQLASIAGVTLTNMRVVYHFRVPFLTMLLTGRMRSTGTAPLQHVSAIEITLRRYPLLLFLALSAAVSSLYVQQMPDAPVSPLVCLGAALLLLLLWLLVRGNAIVVTVDGTRFVAVAARLARSEVEKFMECYAEIKSDEWGKLAFGGGHG